MIASDEAAESISDSASISIFIRSTLLRPSVMSSMTPPS